MLFWFVPGYAFAIEVEWGVLVVNFCNSVVLYSQTIVLIS
jgi:hypothetical protein